MGIAANYNPPKGIGKYAPPSKADCAFAFNAACMPRGELRSVLGAGFSARGRGRNEAGDTAKRAFERLAFAVAGHAAAGNLAAGGQVGQGESHLGQGDAGGSRNLRIKELAVFLQALENWRGIHL